MSGLRISLAVLVALLVSAAAQADPERLAEPMIDPAVQQNVELAETDPKILDRASIFEGPDETNVLSCAQQCDQRAHQTEQTCRATIARLHSDPSWMDGGLSVDQCEAAAQSGARICLRNCPQDPSVDRHDDRAGPQTP